MLSVGQQIFLVTGTATAHCAVAVSGIHAIVTSESEKAVQLTALAESGAMTKSACWLPRKAIVSKLCEVGKKHEHTAHTMARWFKPAGFTAHWISRHIHHALLAS